MGKDVAVDMLPYKASTSEDQGLIATKDLTPDDLVLSERPLVFAPKSMPDPEASMPCVGCYKLVFTDVGERCPKCGWPVCSGYCPGLKDPRHHGIECEILNARPECVLDNMADYYRHDALLPLRCILLQKVDPEKWNRLLELQSNMDSRTPGSDVYEEANEFVVQYLIQNFINKLKKDTKEKYIPEISAELIHKMCGIIDTNALEISLSDQVELCALFTNFCMMNNSCIPNTKHVFDRTPKEKLDLYKISVKIVVPVKKGDHITTIYTNALWGTQARRQHLLDTRYVDCKCLRCSDPTELGSYLSAMKCLGDGSSPCDGIHLAENPLDEETDWACNKCDVKVNNAQVNMLIAQMGDEVENVQMTGGRSVTLLENLLCKLSTFLHPNHYHLYSIKHSLIQLYGRQLNYSSDEYLNKKIKMCEDLSGITKIIDPGNAKLSLYYGVIQHELHSALLLKSKTAKGDDEVKALLVEAKQAIEEGIASLKDERDVDAGKKLFSVLIDVNKQFLRYCSQKNISI